MEKVLIKVCPACKNQNMANEIMCVKCGTDISSVKALTELELQEKRDEQLNRNVTRNRETITESDSAEFKKVFADELKPRQKKHVELYPRTKEDEEAEKIIADIKGKAVRAGESIKNKIKDFFKKIKNR